MVVVSAKAGRQLLHMQAKGPASALHTFSAGLCRPYLFSIALVSTRGSLIVSTACVACALRLLLMR